MLDACRYDYFKRLYSQFPYLDKGILEKRKSKGSDTVEWLKATFSGYYEDITYFSANPYVNSTGTAFREFSASDHFSEIVDIWLESWDETKGTVFPDKVNESFYEVKGRAVIHYIQPHRPYLSSDISMDWSNRKKTKDKKKGKSIFGKVKEKVPFKEFLKRKRKNLYYRWHWNLFFWKMRKIWDLEPVDDFEMVWREYSKQEIRELYTDNLEAVLLAVSDLLKGLENETVVITSDHGEALGERGYWKHRPGLDIPEVTTVPWLKIKV